MSADPSISTSNASTLGINWMTYMGSYPLSSPIVVWNPTLSETLVYTANEAGYVVAYNEATGTPVWSDNLGVRPVNSTPLAEGGYLWVAPNWGGRLYKLNAATGANHLLGAGDVWGHPADTRRGARSRHPAGRQADRLHGRQRRGGQRTAHRRQRGQLCRRLLVLAPQAASGRIWNFIGYAVTATGEGVVLSATAILMQPSTPTTPSLAHSCGARPPTTRHPTSTTSAPE